MARWLFACLLAVSCFREAPPCTPEDYDRLADTCEDCPREIADRRALCEKLIREDDAK